MRSGPLRRPIKTEPFEMFESHFHGYRLAMYAMSPRTKVSTYPASRNAAHSLLYRVTRMVLLLDCVV